MTKDRLAQLQQQNGEVSINLLETSDATSEDTNKEIRKTFEKAEVLRQWIENIEGNNEATGLHLKEIDNVKCNRKDVEDKIQSIFQKNTTIAQQVTNTLKEMNGEIQSKGNLQSAEGRIKEIQYNTLKTRFQEAFIKSTELLESYKNIQKQLLQAQINAKGRQVISDEELTSLIEEGKDIQLFTENILMETADAKRQLADIEERHQNLLKIEKLLIEVRDLFIQMSILVDSQKPLIDRIEYQAEIATNCVGEGAVDLSKVKRSKNRYLKRKIYCFLIVFIVVIILLIILFK